MSDSERNACLATVLFWIQATPIQLWPSRRKSGPSARECPAKDPTYPSDPDRSEYKVLRLQRIFRLFCRLPRQCRACATYWMYRASHIQDNARRPSCRGLKRHPTASALPRPALRWWNRQAFLSDPRWGVSAASRRLLCVRLQSAWGICCRQIQSLPDVPSRIAPCWAWTQLSSQAGRLRV